MSSNVHPNQMYACVDTKACMKGACGMMCGIVDAGSMVYRLLHNHLLL